MSGKLNTGDLSDEDLVKLLTPTQLLEYREGWENLGYGIKNFARWYLSLDNSTMPRLYQSYLSKMLFTEEWWEPSKGDVYLAEEAGQLGLDPAEYLAYDENGFRALWKMRDFKLEGYGLAEINTLNSYGLKVRKDLLDLESDQKERHLLLTRSLGVDGILKETSDYIFRLLSEDKVIHYSSIPAEDITKAIIGLDQMVQRLFGDDGMKNYSLLLDIFDQSMLTPSILNGQSFGSFIDLLPELTSSGQVYTLASWIKAYGDSNCSLSFEDEGLKERIMNGIGFSQNTDSGQSTQVNV